MSKKKESTNDDEANVTTVKVHEGRLRKLLQFLKEKEAIITVDHDIYGRSTTTRYSDSSETEYSIKDLALSIWTDKTSATDWVYYDYLKSDYEVSRKRTAGKYHPSYEKFIVGITCTFMETPGIENRAEKEQLFFSGDRPEQTNLLATFPDFRQGVKDEIKQFAALLQNGSEGFPYQQLRNHTAHRCHRYKKLEKDIFQYLKDATPSEVQDIGSRLAEVMSAYGDHLEQLERGGTSHENPKDGQVVEDRLQFKELSEPEDIAISLEEEQQLEDIGFEDAFSGKEHWLDGLRFKKITYWKQALDEVAISEWPDYVLEHILLAYFELNTVCSQIVDLRDQVYNEVSYYVKNSMDGKEIFTIKEVLTHHDLASMLSQYEYESNAFVDALRSDGNLLDKPLKQLPQNFDGVSSPDRLFYSRIEKLLWEYLLFRMCDSCQLNKDHVAEFYTPLYNPAK
ncbi:hypothetical protein NC796_13875 [Aliifodinibius sp. S!AR15-10]|uniref:hypothetical protein n=1 Tax=Aliifodinibius sp. S!AR15-10 TaxID=2950437 RepID=UPI00285EA187|nr:hypothetical protein [Aliifodinibius sp. S!AR15-10]MDR8392237.1 hypothetical protein [Aliifodinibius sp. S!AR15-10]